MLWNGVLIALVVGDRRVAHGLAMVVLVAAMLPLLFGVAVTVLLAELAAPVADGACVDPQSGEALVGFARLRCDDVSWP